MRTRLVYLDTSVVGGCFDEEFSPWSNGLLKDVETGLLRGATSEIVAIEVEKAREEVQEKYDEFLACSPLVLDVNDDVLLLLDAYLGHGILTEKYRNDMLHVALATAHAVDIVASWNFRHIVRHEKIVKFNAVNLELGFHQVAIHSPREVASHEAL